MPWPDGLGYFQLLAVDYEYEIRHPTYSLGYGPRNPPSCYINIDGLRPSRDQDEDDGRPECRPMNASSDYGIEDGKEVVFAD